MAAASSATYPCTRARAGVASRDSCRPPKAPFEPSRVSVRSTRSVTSSGTYRSAFFPSPARRRRATVLALAFLSLSCCDAAVPRRGGLSPDDGLFDMTGSVGLSQLHGEVVAFGDFNNDRFTDVFALHVNTDGAPEIEVWKWSKSGRFEAITRASGLDPGDQVQSVVPGDFNYDGKLDVMAWGLNRLNKPFMRFWINNEYKTLDAVARDTVTGIHVPVEPPLVVDWNGDFLLDFFATDSFGNRALWVAQETEAGKPQLSYERLAVMPGQWPLSATHPHAFVDIDGDCQPDLAVVSHAPGNTSELLLEVWLNHVHELTETPYKDKFRLAASLPLPRGTGPLSWADFDRDGAMDTAFPVCVHEHGQFSGCDRKQELHVLYNTVPKRTTEHQCAFKDYEFELPSPMSSSGPRHTIDDLNAQLPDWYLSGFTVPESSDPNITSPDGALLPGRPETAQFLPFLRVGDLDNDGYDDVAATFTRRTRPVVQQAAVLMNRKNRNLGGVSPRTFQKLGQGFEIDDLENMDTAVAVTLFDVAENGLVDVFVLYRDPDTVPTVPTSTAGADTEAEAGRHQPAATSGEASSRVPVADLRVSVLQNNFHTDAFFLKAVGLNGRCPAGCKTSPANPDPKPYGVNYPGAVIKFVVTDVDGSDHLRVGGQLSQSSHGALQTPYVSFGLGRTNNYVEVFFIGVPYQFKGAGRAYNDWPAIMPNSFLFMFPYEHDLPDWWTLELFLVQSDSLLIVTLACAASLFLSGVAIVYFHWKEMKEDEKEKKRTQQHFVGF